MSNITPKRENTVLIISTDLPFRAKLREHLTTQSFQIFEADTQSIAFGILENHQIGIVLLDMEHMPAIELDIVSYIRSQYHSEIIVLTTFDKLEEATNALRNGAAFYLVKPIKLTDLKSALDKLTIRVEQIIDHKELEQRFLSDLMSGSPAMEKVLKFAMKISPTNSTVLIGGESGTGKELFAKIIHRLSKRLDGKFVAMNCGAIPDTLFESEFFGHKKGAFTGADRDKSGLVEEAHMGTLFLDEVGELSPSAQVKLLRFLQEREFRRVGDSLTRSVDTRIIAATNRDLAKLMEQGKFREDLFYRLNVFYLYLPPLRERKETIPNLIRIFVHRYNQLFEKHINHISKNAEAILANYNYPGNVRELENILEHAVVLANDPEITEQDLPDFMFRNRLLLNGPSVENDAASDKVLTLAEMEMKHISQVLSLTNSNFTDASRKLGISRSTLWRKIKEYNIETN